MANHKHKQPALEDHAAPGATRLEARPGLPPKMKRKEYEREMKLLHGELVAMQEWVKATGAKICIVFEGRGPLQAAHPPRRHAAQTAAGPRLRAAGPVLAVHPGTVLGR